MSSNPVGDIEMKRQGNLESNTDVGDDDLEKIQNALLLNLLPKNSKGYVLTMTQTGSFVPSSNFTVL